MTFLAMDAKVEPVSPSPTTESNAFIQVYISNKTFVICSINFFVALFYEAAPLNSNGKAGVYIFEGWVRIRGYTHPGALTSKSRAYVVY